MESLMAMMMGKSDKQSRLALSNTAPIWLQDHYLGNGHDVTTHNGTATFVMFDGRIYAVTCRHIAHAALDQEVVPGARFPNLALMVGNGVLNLAAPTPDGLRSKVRTIISSEFAPDTDIAVVEMPNSYWTFLQSKGAKVAIDLERWIEPDWPAVGPCYVAGYADEHKEIVVNDRQIEQIATPMLTIVADVADPLKGGEHIITLSSRLEEPHGYFFSGVSGGPIYAIREDEALLPIGIVFEGYPSKRSLADERAGGPAFLDEHDIFIRGLALTPTDFEQWLKLAS